MSEITKSNTGKRSITVIGLGLMGQALAKSFMDQGYKTTVWNRTASKAEELVTMGATLSETMEEAILSNSVMIVCLSTYEVMDQLLQPHVEKLAGRVLINLTSGTPDDARNMAKWAATHGISYLDGAIMAVPPMIGSPEALLFYGGSETIFQRYKPLLQVLGGNTVYLSEDPGIPMLYDLALLTLLYGTGHGWIHAHALISTANISASDFQSFATEWLNHVVTPSYASSDAARILDESDYATDVSNLRTNQLALGHIVQASRELDVPVDWLTPIQTIFDQLVKAGYGEDDPARVFEYIRPKRSQ